MKIKFLIVFAVFYLMLFSINAQVTGTITDSRDGKVYKTVTLGTQTWMAENLAFKADSACWAFNNDTTYVSKYGYLYDVASAKKSCPSGWHLPSDDEWKTLELFLGIKKNELDNIGWRGKREGDMLKNKLLWNPPDNGWGKTAKDTCSDCFGFGAVPAGVCGSGYWMYELKFSTNGFATYFWASTPTVGIWVWERQLNRENSGIYRSKGDGGSGASVRCVKD